MPSSAHTGPGHDYLATDCTSASQPIEVAKIHLAKSDEERTGNINAQEMASVTSVLAMDSPLRHAMPEEMNLVKVALVPARGDQPTKTTVAMYMHKHESLFDWARRASVQCLRGMWQQILYYMISAALVDISMSGATARNFYTLLWKVELSFMLLSASPF